MQTGKKGMLRTTILVSLLLALLSGHAFADTLKPGSKSAAVSDLQQNLKDKGYFSAQVITDRYTTTLKKAVGVFQIANSVKPAYGYGIADEETQLLAASPDAVTYPQYIEKLTDNQLQPGHSGVYVKKAQKRLKSLGYYSSKIDGRYRSTTEAAVAYFQTANSLSSSGVADSATRAVLYGDDPAPVTRAQYEAANFLTPLSIGAKGSQVTQLQERLAEKGYYWSEPTGVFDAQTKYSVKFFQEANGFSASGKANQTLRAKANTEDTVSFDDYTKSMRLTLLSNRAKPGIKVALLQLQLKNLGYYKGIVNGAFTGSVTTAVRTFQIFNNMSSKYVTGKANLETRTLLLDEDALSYDDVCGSDTLKIGSTGDAVKSLQTRLKELGYYTGSVDGVYDSAVATAVKLFQRYNDLYQTGTAYTNTLTALNSASAKSYTNAHIDELLKFADKQLGDEYTSGKRGPDEFDCSGFTYYCLKHVGINVSAEVQTQGRQMLKLGKKITNYKDLKPGDILYFWSPDHKKKPGHAGIFYKIKGSTYYFIHASSTKDKVTYSDLNTSYYLDDDDGAFLYGVRIWE